MNKKLRMALVAATSVLLLSSCNLGEVLRDSGADGLTSLSENEIISGLQESLVLGSKTAALDLGEVDGYLANELVKIAIPDTIEQYFDEVDKLEAAAKKALSLSKASNRALGKQSTAQLLALEKQVASLSIISSAIRPYKDSIVTALNRGAEKAAPNSVDVFKNAIFDMSFDDARGLLSSKDTIAATSFLKGVTYTGLNVAFKPILQEPLELLNPNKYWTPVASKFNNFLGTYNSLRTGLGASLLGYDSWPASKYSAAPTDLSDYLATYGTGKALDGLFYMVGVQESKLRADPWAALSAVGDLVSDTVGDLIGKVFDQAGE